MCSPLLEEKASCFTIETLSSIFSVSYSQWKVELDTYLPSLACKRDSALCFSELFHFTFVALLFYSILMYVGLSCSEHITFVFSLLLEVVKHIIRRLLMND